MLDIAVVTFGIVTAFGLVFFGLFMRFGRHWNGR